MCLTDQMKHMQVGHEARARARRMLLAASHRLELYHLIKEMRVQSALD